MTDSRATLRAWRPSIMEQCPSVDHWQTRNPGLELSKTENPGLEKTAGFANPILEAAGYLSTWLRTSHSGGCWLPVNMAQNQPLWRLLAMSGVMHSCGASQKWWWWWCLKKLILLLVISVIFHWKPPTSKTDIWATHKLLVCFDFWGTFNLFLTSCSFPITKAK